MHIFLLWMTAVLVPEVYSYWGRLNQPCTSHWECREVKYTHCDHGKCLCLPGYKKESDERCVGKINAKCDGDDDCFNSECIMNTCQNYSIFFSQASTEQKKLYRAATIDSHCETDEHCSNHLHTKCLSGTCKCDRGYYKHNSDRSCRSVSSTNCEKTSDCQESGNQCFFEICMRPEDFFVESNAHNISLYVSRYIGDHCRTDFNCRNVANSYCKDGFCACNPDFAYEFHRCRYGLNAYCTEDSHCEISGSKCFLEKCRFPDDFFAPSNSQEAELYVANGINGYCRTNDHCKIENTHCYNEKCVCKEGYEHYSYSSSCAVKTFNNCSEDSDCAEGKYCFFNICYFPDDYFTPSNFNNTKLYIAKDFGSYCNVNAHCRRLTKSECHEHKCINCNDYYNIYNHGPQIQCKRPLRSEQLKPCSKNSNCSNGDVCIFFECRSTPVDMDDIDLQQHVARRVEDNCFAENDCQYINNSVCEKYHCVCKPPYESILGECVKKKLDSCLLDSRCADSHAFCFEGTCVYPEDFFTESNAQNSSRYAAKQLFDVCHTDHHCRDVNNSYCYDNICYCRHGYEMISGECKQMINITCSDQSDCLLPRSVCILGTCLYPEDFINPADGYNTSLYATKRIHEFCQTHHHCREITHSICINRKCVCDNDYIPIGDRCRLAETEFAVHNEELIDV